MHSRPARSHAASTINSPTPAATILRMLCLSAILDMPLDMIDICRDFACAAIESAPSSPSSSRSEHTVLASLLSAPSRLFGPLSGVSHEYASGFISPSARYASAVIEKSSDESGAEPQER